ncbi:hypothetical protein PAMA_007629 [Pampus argenteus]
MMHVLSIRDDGRTNTTQLVDMWSVRGSRIGRRAMELTAYPQMLQGGYNRVTGLHYMSSFSDAEDCCDDSSSGSSLTLDWHTQTDG